jgi:hypothetical protein
MRQACAEVVHAAGVGEVCDQAGVVGRVGDCGDAGEQGVQEGAAADVVELAGAAQLLEDGDGVGGLAPVG